MLLACQSMLRSEEVSAKKIIDLLSERAKKVENITCTVVWTDFTAGHEAERKGMLPTPTQRNVSRETYFQDRKGRQLLRSQRLMREADKVKMDGVELIFRDSSPEFSELLANGTLGLRYERFIGRDAHGQPTAGNDIQTDYHSAQVSEEKMIKDAVFSLKKPFDSANMGLIFALKHAEETRSPLTVIQEGEMMVVSGTDFLGHPAYKNGKWKAQIDMAKGYVVASVDVLYPSGNLARIVRCDYVQDEKGLWQERTGVVSQFKDSDAKELILEWKFEIEMMRFNDPNFPHDVFDVKLPPGTSVSDLRYGVTYELGSEGAMSSELERLSREASGMKFPNRVYNILSSISLWCGIVLILLACMSKCYTWYKASRIG
jgi:hypothetical protein